MRKHLLIETIHIRFTGQSVVLLMKTRTAILSPLRCCKMSNLKYKILYQAASLLVEQLFQQDVSFYKIGVGLIDLVHGLHEQHDLFSLTPNNPKLMNVYDTLNNQFESDVIFLVAQGITQKWAMQHEMLSPQYTTRRQDLPKIKC